MSPITSPIFALALILTTWPHLSAAQNAPPTSEQLKAFVQVAHLRAKTHNQVIIPHQIFAQLSREFEQDNSIADGDCERPSRREFKSYEIAFGPKTVGVAVQASSVPCLCSPTGNCAFWIFAAAGQTYRKVLSLGSVQMFGFLKSGRNSYPDVVVWSHGSAFESGGRLFRFNKQKYREADSWDEEYDFDDKTQSVDPGSLHVTLDFWDGHPLPRKQE